MTNRYLVVIEGDDQTNYSAYSPDVPGVVATGPTREACAEQMRSAVAFHLEGLGEDPPVPTSTAAYVDVTLA